MEISLPISDKSFIESLIPQRDPFVMVNTLTEYTEDSLNSAFLIKEENIFVQGEIFHAAGVIEHQAQSVALHTGYKYYLSGQESPTGYIGAIKSFESVALPKVGDLLETEVSIINEVMGVTLVSITTRVKGNIIATSQMKTVVK
ncbi:hypothetical protein [Chryseobacterium sp. CT-SW4]|uniref:hypothetical protein n=1 Tax=Chryseobacterium sp. SW-1 TaxID=3157343 RepID=UPI003B0154A0